MGDDIEFNMLEDRAMIAEDKLRILRSEFGHKKKIPWWPFTTRRIVKRIHHTLFIPDEEPTE